MISGSRTRPARTLHTRVGQTVRKSQVQFPDKHK